MTKEELDAIRERNETWKGQLGKVRHVPSSLLMVKVTGRELGQFFDDVDALLAEVDEYADAERCVMCQGIILPRYREAHTRVCATDAQINELHELRAEVERLGCEIQTRLAITAAAALRP